MQFDFDSIKFDSINNIASYVYDYDHIVVVSGSGAENKYSTLIVDIIKSSLCDTVVNSINIDSGEKSKSPDVVIYLCKAFTMLKVNRSCLVIAVGGGALLDCVGFCASIYKRGVNLITVPTTLLAMADASVGGKRGINTEFGKNQIGTFYEAITNVIDVNLLKTLDCCNYQNGMCEILKCAFICKSFYNTLSSMDFDVFKNYEKNLSLIEKLLHYSVKAKLFYVKKDYYDVTDSRIFLNYGHTLGHAIEAQFSDLKISHGIAIAQGMDFAAYLSDQLNLSSLILEKQRFYFKCIGILEFLDEFRNNYLNKKIFNLIDFMLQDKKNDDKKDIKFVLLADFGDVVLKYVGVSKLRQLLTRYCQTKM